MKYLLALIHELRTVERTGAKKNEIIISDEMANYIADMLEGMIAKRKRIRKKIQRGGL